MITLSLRIVAEFVGSGCPADRDQIRPVPGNVFTAPVARHSITQTFPGLSPTQSSVWLLAVTTPSGPEVSLLPQLSPRTPG